MSPTTLGSSSQLTDKGVSMRWSPPICNPVDITTSDSIPDSLGWSARQNKVPSTTLCSIRPVTERPSCETDTATKSLTTSFENGKSLRPSKIRIPSPVSPSKSVRKSRKYETSLCAGHASAGQNGDTKKTKQGSHDVIQCLI